jgi:hypothetical protein
MSKDNFQLAYDGPAVREGSMDVYDLAPALLGIGDLVRDANRFLNQDRADVSVQVESDFQHGSFEISLMVDQTVLAQAKEMLFAGSISEAKELLMLLFGTTSVAGAVVGAIKIYKMLKGKKPEAASIKIDNSQTTIINNIAVEARTANLYLNDDIRSQLDRVVAPITKPGFDKMEVRKNKAVLEELRKADLPDRLLESGEASSQDSLVNSREAFLSVETANFAKGKWRFSDGTAKFNAQLNDPAFRQHIDSREEGFFSGDTLRVSLTTTQTVKPDGKIQTTYSIDKVLEHRHGPTQERLLPPPPPTKENTGT